MKAPRRAVIPAPGFPLPPTPGTGTGCHPTPGTGTGLPPHPDSDPAPAVSGRPMACQQARADVRPASARVPAAPPRTGGGCLAADPAGCSPVPAVLVLRVYEERAWLTPTTFLGFFSRTLRRLVQAFSEGPFPQVDDRTRRPAGSLPLPAR